jgi:hypothetical protein
MLTSAEMSLTSLPQTLYNCFHSTHNHSLQIPHTSHRHFISLARRFGYIFAHSYFHYREAFEQAEAESSLYARFLALTSKFDLVPAEFLVIPPRLTLSDGNDIRDADVHGYWLQRLTRKVSETMNKGRMR